MPKPILNPRATRPLIVGTLTGQGKLSAQLAAARSPLIDVVELRLDTFPGVFSSSARAFSLNLMQRVRKVSRKPILLTLRSHTECGVPVRPSRRLTDKQRETLVTPLLPLAALVDVEARRPLYARRVSAVARRLGIPVIQSYHDFKGANLSGPARWASRSRADVFKVAVTPKNDRELDAFLRWGLSLSGPRILIGMGPASAMTRVVGFTFGSVLTYGHLGQSAAPGQMSALDLARRVRAVYGPSR